MEANFAGCLDQAPHGDIADHDLKRRRDRCHRERDDKTQTVDPIAVTLDPPPGIHAGDQETRNHIGGEQHVDILDHGARV